MTSTELSIFKKRLQSLLALGETKDVIDLLKIHIPEHTKKILEITHIEVRIGNLNRDKAKGVLSHEQADISLNKINNDLITFIDGLKEIDFKIPEGKSSTKTILKRFKEITSYKNIKLVTYFVVPFLLVTIIIWVAPKFFTKVENPPELSPLLTVFIFDKSPSSNYIEINEVELYKYCQEVKTRPAFQFAAIFIKENSNIQSPYISNIIIPPQKIENVYERSIALKQYKTLLEESSNQIISLSKSTVSENFSDVNGALEMANLLCSQPIYSNFDIRVITLSDMKQSNEARSILQINPVRFPNNVKIFLIGAKDIDYSKIFPNNSAVPLIAFKSEFIK